MDQAIGSATIRRGARWRRYLLCAAGMSLTLLPGSAVLGQTGSVYANPVWDDTMADPSVIVDKNTNKIYVFGTGNVSKDTAEGGPMMVGSLTNITNWSTPVDVVELPSWADTTKGIWAPHVVENPDKSDTTRKYVMFFTAKARVGNGRGLVPDSNCMSVAFTSSLDRPFKAEDDPIDPTICATPGNSADGMIDPFFYYDEASNTRWLYWGSHFKPLRRQKLNQSLTHFADGSSAQFLQNYVGNTGADATVMKGTWDGRRMNDENQTPIKEKYTDMLEGIWITKREGKFYMFTSGYECCDTASDHPGGYDYSKGYSVVAWSADALSTGTNGIWRRRPESTNTPDGAILHSDMASDRFESPGHNSVFVDGAGDYWIVYHARRTKNATETRPETRVLMIDKLKWVKDGLGREWPAIDGDANRAAVPSEGTKAAPKPFS